MLAEFMFRPFEALLNRGLGASSEAQALATSLEGRDLGLTIEGTPFDARLRIVGQRFSVALPDGSIPDASLSGGPMGMIRLLGRDPQAAIHDGSVRITGDTGLAEQFRELLRLAAPNLERELSRFIGEPLAREFAGAKQAAARWGEETGDKIAQHVSQYLKDDARLVPSTCELAGFTRDVEALANDVDCAEARISRLKDAL
jgi:ubiquinone biosynthesis accessory factor UbiJ